MKKVDILWISMAAPYDNVPHAGGKIHNFYLKKLVIEEPNLHLLTRAYSSTLPKLDLREYQISYDVIVVKETVLSKLLRGIKRSIAEVNIFEKYAGILLKYQEREFVRFLKKYVKKNIAPSVIILEWTECVLLGKVIKKIFPNARLVGIEEDVSYLGYYRKYQYANNVIWKYIRKKRYQHLKEIELQAIDLLDLVILNNEKDRQLLIKEKVNENKIFVWCPFFQSYLDIQRDKEYTNEIIFYGAMDRRENYLSAIWFIENVFIKLESVKFIIIGGNPHSSLKKYQNDKVVVTGFVEDVSIYLRRAMCMVAPLVMGAGVKIKILEGLSAGIPILTNNIGIEGIPAVKGRDYYYCNKPEEYIEIINKLKKNKNEIDLMSERSKNFIKEHYNIKQSEREFINRITNLKTE